MTSVTLPQNNDHGTIIVMNIISITQYCYLVHTKVISGDLLFPHALVPHILFPPGIQTPDLDTKVGHDLEPHKVKSQNSEYDLCPLLLWLGHRQQIVIESYSL